MKFVPLFVPWLVAPGMFSIFVAAVHSWKTDSLQIALLFVVLPVAVWIAMLRSCKKQIHDPAFAPSFVAAVVVTDVITYLVDLRPAISAGLEVALGLSTLSLLFLFWRVINSDPGRLRIFTESSAGAGAHDRDSIFGLAGSPQTEGWGPEKIDGESVGERDLEIQKGETYQALRRSGINGEEAVGALHLPEESPLKRIPLRARYCRKCNAWIDHFDHHCPAIKNCVGRKNHVLFLVVLVAFITAELLYIRCCYMYLKGQHLWLLAEDSPSTLPIGLQGLEKSWLVSCLAITEAPWVVSTAAFAALQASWQIPMLMFHIYCASLNLTTSEWIKWEDCPNLHIELPSGPGRPFGAKRFVNPYDQGILVNLQQFFQCCV